MKAIFPRNKLKTSTINITKKGSCTIATAFHIVCKPILSDCISQRYLFIGRKLSGLNSKTPSDMIKYQ